MDSKERNTPPRMLYVDIQRELAHARDAIGNDGAETFTREDAVKALMLVQHHIAEIGKEHGIADDVHLIWYGVPKEMKRRNRYTMHKIQSLEDATSWIGRTGKSRRTRRNEPAMQAGRTVPAQIRHDKGPANGPGIV